MKWIKYFLIFNLTLLSIVRSCPTEICVYADSLFMEKAFYECITAYYRVIFESNDSCQIALCFHKIGIAERELGESEKALAAFNKALSFSKNDTLAQFTQLSSASTLIGQNKFALADLKLIKIRSHPETEDIHRAANTQYYLSQILQGNYNEAYQILLNNKVYIPDASIEASLQILENAKTKKNKSIKTAKKLSTIFPGAGQCYAGDHKNAVNAFLLNALNIGINSSLIMSGSYFDAIVYFSSITERYYSGNRYRAAVSVEQKEKQFIQQTNANIFEKLNEYPF